MVVLVPELVNIQMWILTHFPVQAEVCTDHFSLYRKTEVVLESTCEMNCFLESSFCALRYGL